MLILTHQWLLLDANIINLEISYLKEITFFYENIQKIRLNILTEIF